MKYFVRVLTALGIILGFPAAAKAEGLRAGVQIASCVVVDSYNHAEDGHTFEVYLFNDAEKSINIVLGKNSKDTAKMMVPAKSYQFSTDNKKLSINAGFFALTITQGKNTPGAAVKKLGGPTSTLSCTANW